MKKTKLKWTKKLPTVDGFYWRRVSSKAGLNCMVVIGGYAFGIGIPETNKDGEWKGEWYGPIPSKEPK